MDKLALFLGTQYKLISLETVVIDQRLIFDREIEQQYKRSLSIFASNFYYLTSRTVFFFNFFSNM